MRCDTLMTLDHTTAQVNGSRYGRAGIGQSSWKGLSTGRHKKALVCCPCSWLATLHGAPRKHLLLSLNRHGLVNFIQQEGMLTPLFHIDWLLASLCFSLVFLFFHFVVVTFTLKSCGSLYTMLLFFSKCLFDRMPFPLVFSFL